MSAPKNASLLRDEEPDAGDPAKQYGSSPEGRYIFLVDGRNSVQ